MSLAIRVIVVVGLIFWLSPLRPVSGDGPSAEHGYVPGSLRTMSTEERAKALEKLAALAETLADVLPKGPSAPERR